MAPELLDIAITDLQTRLYLGIIIPHNHHYLSIAVHSTLRTETQAFKTIQNIPYKVQMSLEWIKRSHK